MKDIIIIGAGGFAREVAWLIEDINKFKSKWNLLGFIDEDKNKVGKIYNGIEVLGDFNWLNKNKNEIYGVCAIGDSKIRAKLINKAIKMGVKFPILIHPSVIMSAYNNIGEGTIICAGSILTTNIVIGKHVIVNLDCTIGHDATIGDYCTMFPSVNISGNTKLNKDVNLGTGSFTIQGVSIGENSIIGAGAIVTKNIPADCTAVGAPAKPIKYHNSNRTKH